MFTPESVSFCENGFTYQDLQARIYMNAYYDLWWLFVSEGPSDTVWSSWDRFCELIKSAKTFSTAVHPSSTPSASQLSLLASRPAEADVYEAGQRLASRLRAFRNSQEISGCHVEEAAHVNNQGLLTAQAFGVLSFRGNDQVALAILILQEEAIAKMGDVKLVDVPTVRSPLDRYSLQVLRTRKFVPFVGSSKFRRVLFWWQLGDLAKKLNISNSIIDLSWRELEEPQDDKLVDLLGWRCDVQNVYADQDVIVCWYCPFLSTAIVERIEKSESLFARAFTEVLVLTRELLALFAGPLGDTIGDPQYFFQRSCDFDALTKSSTTISDAIRSRAIFDMMRYDIGFPLSHRIKLFSLGAI